MTSDDLIEEQVKKVQAVVGDQLRYLVRLRRRIELKGFPPADPLYYDVARAHDAVHALSVELHYLCVGSGVGRTPKRPPV